MIFRATLINDSGCHFDSCKFSGALTDAAITRAKKWAAHRGGEYLLEVSRHDVGHRHEVVGEYRYSGACRNGMTV